MVPSKSDDPVRNPAKSESDQDAREHGDSLQDGLAQLAAIVDSSDDAIVSKTLDGTICSWNAAAERIFGWSRDEAVGRPVALIIPGDLHDEERAILSKIRAGERIEHFETERVARDGRRVPISLSVSPVRDAQGRIVGAAKIARDISDRRRAGDAVQAARENLALEARALMLLNECSTRLWRCQSLDDGLDRMLDAVIELVGADRGNIQLLDGATLRIVAHRGFDRPFLEFFREVSSDDACGCGRVLRSKQREIIEDVERDPAYAPFLPVVREAGFRAVVCTPLFAGDGAFLGVLNAYFDRTHHPAARELRCLDLFARQAGDFVQRCRMEQALRSSEAALRASDRRKNVFLATLAHELRNPLAPISSGLQIMEMARGDLHLIEQTRAMLRRQVDHMTRLVEDLMDVSRIGQGKVDLRLQEFDANAFLPTVAESHRPRIESSGLVLIVRPWTDPLLLRADATRLTQVVSNLLTNAAKYTPSGGVITLLAQRDGDHALLRVRDTGLGIPAHMIDRVFDLFTQIDDSLDRADGGVGIGLSLVKGLVEAHGGTVSVRSDGPGQGSEFSVRLPLADAAGEERET